MLQILWHSFHQKAETMSLLLETGWAFLTASANRIQWKWCCVISKSRLEKVRYKASAGVSWDTCSASFLLPSRKSSHPEVAWRDDIVRPHRDRGRGCSSSWSPCSQPAVWFFQVRSQKWEWRSFKDVPTSSHLQIALEWASRVSPGYLAEPSQSPESWTK